MSKTIKKQFVKHKKMKSMLEVAGLPSQQKATTQNAGRTNYWGRSPVILRDDGSIGKDKTFNNGTTKGAKEAARQTNRAHTKKARQILKRQMHETISDTVP